VVWDEDAKKILLVDHKKAQLWLNGRKNIHDRIKASCDASLKPIIWMHCASLGEFEQGRELLESIKKYYPTYRIHAGANLAHVSFSPFVKV
jgi:3-deoxy-D-manno-octulosonic-acid transferase